MFSVLSFKIKTLLKKRNSKTVSVWRNVCSRKNKQEDVLRGVFVQKKQCSGNQEAILRETRSPKRKASWDVTGAGNPKCPRLTTASKFSKGWPSDTAGCGDEGLSEDVTGAMLSKRHGEGGWGRERNAARMTQLQEKGVSTAENPCTHHRGKALVLGSPCVNSALFQQLSLQLPEIENTVAWKLCNRHSYLMLFLYYSLWSFE